MRTPTTLSCCLFTLAALLATTLLQAAPPAIAANSQFTIPMDNGQNATAICLPAPNESLWLVISTTTGSITSFQLTPTGLQPIPQPPTPPPPPVPEPKPTRDAKNVISIGEQSAPSAPTAVTKILSAAGIEYHAYSIEAITDPTTSADALKWIGLSAGHPRPWTYILAEDNAILWQGPTPTDLTAWQQALATLQPTAAAPESAATDPSANCRTLSQLPATPNQE